MILGIESTAHTFGVGVVDKGKILSNEKDSYTTEKGGIIPMESAKHHEEVAEKVYREALEKAGVGVKEIKAVAISNAPGLAPCLLQGMKFAKKKAKELKVPIIPVNHCVAHLEIGRLTGAEDPVLLYTSGANTQIIAYVSENSESKFSDDHQKCKNKSISETSGKYRIFGETLDIGVGNFIDIFARYAGIGFPGGPRIQELAEKSNEKNYIVLPYSVKGMDVAFSGILTKLRQLLENEKEKLEDLCFSLQETAFAMLVEAAERALAHTGKKELLLGGGVACNKRLQEMCKIMCRERGASFFVPENSLLVDNAGMIAFLGEIMFNKGIKVEGKDIEKLDINPRERTDDVDVRWK